MRKIQSIVAALVCLLAVSARAQDSKSTTERTIVLDISVVELTASRAEDIESISKDKSKIQSLISAGRARPIASVQLRSRSGADASTRVGQRVPIMTGQQTPNAPAQINYENTGLNVSARVQQLVADQIEVKLNLEMTMVDRSTGNLTATFVQRSMNDVVRVRSGETTLLLGVMQHDPLWPATAQSSARPADASGGSFVVLMTARLMD